MLSKLLFLASAVFAYTEEEFLKNTVEDPQELAVILEVSRAPCVFKVENKFYDYTPIRLAYPNPMVPYIDGNAIPRSPTIQYQFVFGWCQHLADIDNQTLCKENVFAGRLDGSDPNPESACMAYSGGNALDDILTEAITGIPMTKERMQAGNSTELSGVKLTYTGGDLCESTQEPTKFSLNMYCDESMGWDEFDFSLGLQGNICEPYLDTVSKAACSNLDVSELWEYI